MPLDIFQKIEARERAAAAAATKPKRRTMYQARLDNGREGSHLCSRARANRAVRLLKSWGLDAYLSCPVSINC